MSEGLGTINAGSLRVIIGSEVELGKRSKFLNHCTTLTDSIFNGLDLRNEISSVAMQKLGETILLKDDGDNTVNGIAI